MVPELPSDAGNTSSYPSTGRDSHSVIETGFLGSTSFLSVFADDGPENISSPGLPIPIGPGRAQSQAYQRGLTPKLHLVEMLRSSFDKYETLVTDYYKRSFFTVIPGPLILPSLSRMRSFLECPDPENAAGNGLRVRKADADHHLAGKITRNSEGPLHISSSTTLEDFLELYTGRHCRWETIGVILALAGTAAVLSPRQTTSESSGKGSAEGKALAADLLAASDVCISICEQHRGLSDIFIWLRYSNAGLAAHILGDMDNHLYRRFGEFVCDLFALGFHRQRSVESGVPFYLSETRKRIFAAACRRDKNLATFLGRPPHIHRSYCDVSLPRDLDDESVALSGNALNRALDSVDAAGWSQVALPERKLRPATVIRLRHHTAVLRERVLELCLGQKSDRVVEDASTLIDESHRMWVSIPSEFRYEPDCWGRLPPTACMVVLTVYLEYLYSVFQLRRILCQANYSRQGDLFQVCVQMLSAILDLVNHSGGRDAILGRYYRIFLFYALPCAGILARELRDCAASGRSLSATVSRSEIIRKLSVIVSWLENADVDPGGERGACVEVTRVVGRLLDEALNTGTSGPLRAETAPHNAALVGNQVRGSEGNFQAQNDWPSGPFSSSIPDFNPRAESWLFDHGMTEEYFSWLDRLDSEGAFPGLDYDLDSTL
ncbi:hypothetical protein H2204_006902 [Knufia peltigerae]|uniref:Xylanolytic transcriptional activator regulatory domain-containing protein n=1 Tax=Knufia peltigerae TaxID=1002370 RepID=A0AA38Y2R1_9EURO|nr:hypothetical protein H2204_006902 [Knufia peltigerae]